MLLAWRTIILHNLWFGPTFLQNNYIVLYIYFMNLIVLLWNIFATTFYQNYFFWKTKYFWIHCNGANCQENGFVKFKRLITLTLIYLDRICCLPYLWILLCNGYTRDDLVEPLENRIFWIIMIIYHFMKASCY